jgi:hypothetical protein
MSDKDEQAQEQEQENLEGAEERTEETPEVEGHKMRGPERLAGPEKHLGPERWR